jgi:hypothetical protein
LKKQKKPPKTPIERAANTILKDQRFVLPLRIWHRGEVGQLAASSGASVVLTGSK